MSQYYSKLANGSINIIYPSKYVGIGTTNPGYKLDVAGDARINDSGAANGTASETMRVVNTAAGATSSYVYIGASSGTDWKLGKNVPGTLSRTNFDITTHAGVFGLTVDTYGKVGIGTTTPYTKLQVDNTLGIYSTDTTTGGQIYLGSSDFYNGSYYNSAPGIGAIISTGCSQPNGLGFYTYTGSANSRTEVMRIENNGWVGIGTTDPSQMLHVDGRAVITSDLIVGKDLGATLYAANQSTFNETSIVLDGDDNVVGLRMTALRTTGASTYEIWADSTALHFDTMNSGRDFVFNSQGGSSDYCNQVWIMQPTGNVGIGTTNPISKLHVSSTSSSYLTIQNTTNAGCAGLNLRDESGTDQFKLFYDLGNNASCAHINGNGLTLYSTQVSAEIAKFGLPTNYTAAYFKGCVGIGTTSPGGLLHLQSDGGNACGSYLLLKHANNNNTDIVATIEFANNLGKTACIQSGTTGHCQSGYMSFSTELSGSASEVMRITEDSNVGIGKTNPGSRLSVDGVYGINVQPGTAGACGSSTAINNLLSLTMPYGPSAASCSNAGARVGVVMRGSLTDPIAGDGQKTAAIYGVSEDVLGYSRKMGMALYTSSFDANAAERVRIDADGNVGIGTTDPSQKLHVYNGRIAVTDGYNIGDTDANTGMFVSNDYFYVQTAGTTRMTVASNGKVGIGTASPVNKLNVCGDIGLQTSQCIGSGSIFGVTGAASWAALELYNASNGFTSLNNQNYGIYLCTNSNPRLTIKQDGTVGIGTTDPGYRLDVCNATTADSGSVVARIKGSNDSGLIIEGANNETATNYGPGRTGSKLILRNLDSTAGNYTLLANYNATGYVNAGISFVNVAHGVTGVTEGSIEFFTRNTTSNYTKQMTLSEDGALRLTQYGSCTFSGTPTMFLTTDSSGNIIEEAFTSVATGGSGTTGYIPKWTSSLCMGNSIICDNGSGIGINTTTISTEANIGGALSFQPGGSAWNPDNSRPQLKRESNGELRISSGKDSASQITFHTNTTNLVSSTEKMRITPGGGVGIGETTPLGKLHVKDGDVVVEQGDLYIASSSGAEGGEDGGGTGKPTLYFSESEGCNVKGWSMGWRYDGDAQSGNSNMLYTVTNAGSSADGHLTVQYGGNVGIGTTTPGCKLDVISGALRISASGETKIHFRETVATDTYADRWTIGNDDAVNNGFVISCGANLDTPRLVVLDTGNVGIGITNPSNKLQVVGGATSVNLAVTGAGEFASNDFGTTFKTTNTSQKRSQIFFKDSADAITARVGNDIEGCNNAKLQFIAGSGSTPHMSILSGGNVGIGTTDPGGVLELRSSTANCMLFGYPSGSGSVHKLAWDSSKVYICADPAAATANSGIGLSVDNSVVLMVTSNVGIGTTDPQVKLEVKGDGEGINLCSNDYMLSRIIPRGSGAALDGGLFSLFCTGIECVRIDGGGNSWIAGGYVGIGTNAVNYPLEVTRNNGGLVSRIYNTNTNGEGVLIRAGDASCKTRAFQVAATDDTKRFTINSDGTVGIGRTDPSNPLEVQWPGDMGVMIRSTSCHSSLYLHACCTGTSGNYIRMHAQNYCYWINHQYNGCLIFRPNATGVVNGQIYFNQNSWVGIGTDAPSTRLDVVNSNCNADHGIRVLNSTANSSANACIRIDGYAGSCLDFARNGGDRWRLNRIAFSDDLELNAYGTSGAGSVMYWDYDTGNIGIGTTSPSAKLDVCGTDTVFSVNGTNGTLFSVEDDLSDSLMSVNDAAGLPVLEVFADSSVCAGRYGCNDFYLTCAGCVGIGTSSPDGPLEIYRGNSGGLGGHIVLNNNGLAVSSETAVIFGDGACLYRRAAISAVTEGSPYCGSLRFKTGNSVYSSLPTRMTITGAGNVGIGTTDPGSCRLYVSGDTHIEPNSTYALRLGRIGGAPNIKAAGDGWMIMDSTGAAVSLNHYINNNVYIGVGGGSVGIGTNSASYKLDISGNARVTTDLFVNDQLAVKTTTLATSNNFHVSSGTTGSASKSSIAVVSVADNSTFSNGIAALHVINSGNRGTKGHSSGSDLLRLEFSNGIHTLFDKDGNVGIGTTDPGANLHIRTATGSDTPGNINSHVMFDVADDGGPAWGIRLGDTGDDGDFNIDRRNGGTWSNVIKLDRTAGHTTVCGRLYNKCAALFGPESIDPDSFALCAGGFGDIADGSGWGARGLFVHGGGTGDAAAIAHNGNCLFFGIQNGSAANSMATWMSVATNCGKTIWGTTTFCGSINNCCNYTGVGDICSCNDIVAGIGDGGVALTTNDGFGNANVTFNHKCGVPEQAGNSGRIEVNTDQCGSASMWFELASNVTCGSAVQTDNILTLCSASIIMHKTTCMCGCVVATKLVDTNNTACCVDPSGTSLLNDLTVNGNLTVQGTTTTLNTEVCTTSAVEIINAGTGPALQVCQTGAQPIAQFFDDNSTNVLDIGNAGIISIGNGGDSTPAGTQFRTVIRGYGGGNRTAYFDGNANASVWWGCGNTPHFAIDSLGGGGASFWTHCGGSWQCRMTLSCTGQFAIGQAPASGNTLTVGGNIYMPAGSVLTWSNGDAEICSSGYALMFKTYDGSTNSEKVRICGNGNVGIGITNPSYNLHVCGSFAATTKSFVIDHPSDPNKLLRYGSLEGPENGVYVRGRCDNCILELPDYWTDLVHEDSITVQITPIGRDQCDNVRKYSVDDVVCNKVHIYTDSEDSVYNYFYNVYGERKDVDRLTVEEDK